MQINLICPIECYLKLIKKFGSAQRAAATIGCREAFVRQCAKRTRPWPSFSIDAYRQIPAEFHELKLDTDPRSPH